MSEYEKNPGPNERSREALEKAAMQDEQMQDVHAQLMREKQEPHEGFSPVPIFLMFAFAALCFWGGVYLVEHSGGYRWDAYSPDFDPAADKPKPPEISLFDRGARIYRNQCAQCHQAEGSGVAGVYPPLAGADWVTGHPQVIARILINGLNGPIEVAGNTYNGNMPAFGPNGLALNDRDIAAVITYVRQEWGNAASEVTPEMISQYVADYGSRTTPWRAEELRENLGPIPEPAPEEPEPEEGAPAEEAGEGEVAMGTLRR
jgi:mono/diheme cytochrome c family protein